MIILLLVLSGVGFILSLIIQVGTFIGVGNAISIPVAKWLHLGLLLVYGLIYVFNKKIGREYWKKAIECSPKIFNFIFFMILIYMIFHVSVGIYGFFRYGKLAESKGQKILSKRGQVVRVLSEEEYTKKYNLSMRRISSIWMVAYLCPFGSALGGLILNKRGEDYVEA